MEPVSYGWTVVRHVRRVCSACVVALLACNDSCHGCQRNVAVMFGLRLLDRCLRAARGAFCLLLWCVCCVSK